MILMDRNIGKTKQLLLSLVLEHYRTASEKYRSIDLASLLEKLLGMLDYELEIMFVGIWTATNLLDYNLVGL